MEKLPGFLLLLATLNVARAQNKLTPKYFKDGGVLTLEPSPRPTGPITNLVWKLQGNLVAEWFKDKDTGQELVPLTYYRTFKGRATMNVTTGRLDIINMTKADTGLYSVEVNSVAQNERYDAVMIKEVPEPEVVTRQLVCSSASDLCMLTCAGDTTGAGPVTYSWRKGDGGWTDSGKDLTFTCRIQNPDSARESRPKRNPLFEKKCPDPERWIQCFGVVRDLWKSRSSRASLLTSCGGNERLWGDRCVPVDAEKGMRIQFKAASPAEGKPRVLP
ncbi:uncharacterized protein LOC117960625 isoform X2 [Etheostoma cragini]|uniref:uncharacterized protein LOC117960625 isoform X2 n=1 Tax=Etheostoma cragini TaxID=417921 RepID=UPI00155E95EC|nr:uncharacterized protein LOC117960625 isoform X2 [Etheostoma cragini]